MQPTTRPVTRDELPETTTIYLECLRGDYCFKPQPYLDALNAAEELAECEEWLYAPGSCNQIFGAFDGGQMAGYIAVGPCTGEQDGGAGEVTGFFIRRAFRRRGTGLRLLRAGLEYLRGLGFDQVILYNYTISEANSYYRRLGGEVIRREIQTPGGMSLETDVFGWQIDRFFAAVVERLAAHNHT